MRTFASLAVVVWSLALVPVGAGAALAAGPNPTNRASLERCLDADYATLLAAERNPGLVREAAQWLASTNQNSRWTDFYKAIAILRQRRPKAAVPLLMKYMVEHAAYGNSRISLPLYADAITVLTGEDVAVPPTQGRDRQDAVVTAVLGLYVDWWKPNANRLTTDVAKMTDEQVGRVVAALVRHSAQELSRHFGSDRQLPTQFAFEGLLYDAADAGGRREWWDEELHPRMAAALLAEAGYVPTPAGDPAAGTAEVDFAVVPLLAALHRRGGGGAMDRVAHDPKQDDAARLACLLAAHAAGVSIHDRSVLPVYKADGRLACRVLAVLMLGLCDEARGDVPTLVAALEDDNREVRAAALSVLRAVSPRAALPKLARVTRTGQPADLVAPGLRLLGAIRGAESAALLIGYMDAALTSGDAPQGDLLQALIAYKEATGADVIEAGAHDRSYYEDAARRAVADWKRHHP